MKLKEISVAHIQRAGQRLTQVTIKASNGIYRHSVSGTGGTYAEAMAHALAELNSRVAPEEQVWPDNVDRATVELIMKAL